MTFQATVPTGGLTGWRFLQRTYNAQIEAFASAPQFSRDTEYFLKNIEAVSSAAELVADRRLLSVALGAFGLQDDLPNKYFIQKIMEDGSTDREALANRLADKRYTRLSQAFRFGPGEIPQTRNSRAMAEIVRLNQVQSFEVSVGETDDTLRISLYAQRELTELARSGSSDTVKWFSIMGLPPLRSMFETALGLPATFSQIDIDQQMEVLRDKTQRLTGSDQIDQFTDPDALEKLTNSYLARSQIANGASGLSSGSVALALLQG